MAASTVSQTSSSFIDPSKVGKYPVHLSEDLLRDRDAASSQSRKRQLVRMQFNHLPRRLEQGSVTIRPSLHSTPGKDKEYEVALRSVGDRDIEQREAAPDAAGVYNYSGNQEASQTEVLALIFDKERQSFLLDRIDANLGFNLKATPSSKDTDDLAQRYPHLGASHSEHHSKHDNGHGDSGDSGHDDDQDQISPDPDNPFDYRHFLHRHHSPSPVHSVRSVSPQPHHLSSPLIHPTSPASRPRSSTESKHRSRISPEKPKPKQKRPKPRSSPPPEPSTEIIISHEDGTQYDPSVLEIDMGDDPPAPSIKSHRATLGVLNLDGHRSGGPISLRSAASSMSPSLRGDSDDEDNHAQDRTRRARDIDNDNDVEEMDLDAPAPRAPAEADDDDDDDGLAAELEQALEEQANEQAAAPTAAEQSSEESEEE